MIQLRKQNNSLSYSKHYCLSQLFSSATNHLSYIPTNNPAFKPRLSNLHTVQFLYREQSMFYDSIHFWRAFKCIFNEIISADVLWSPVLLLVSCHWPFVLYSRWSEKRVWIIFCPFISSQCNTSLLKDLKHWLLSLWLKYFLFMWLFHLTTATSALILTEVLTML